MLTSQHGCQFPMFIFLLCCSFCTPEGEISYPVWQTKDYEFTIDDFPPPTEKLVSFPLVGESGPRLLERHPYKSSTSGSRLSLEEEMEDHSTAPTSSTAPRSPLDVFIGEYLLRSRLASPPPISPPVANNQNYRQGSAFPTPRGGRIDWSDVRLQSSLTEEDAAGVSRRSESPGDATGNFDGASDRMISNLISENLPLMSKRILVKKRIPNRHTAIKRWWGNYYRPRPQMDRRAAQSKHYGCLKRCIDAGKLHPIQCHTLC